MNFPWETRFLDKVSTHPSGCLVWTASTRGKGYGRFWLDGKMQFAHRVAYLLATGQEVPQDKTIDHLCKNRLCVNSDHLEVVDLQENILRSDCPPARNARKRFCKNGHPFSPDNTYIFTKNTGKFRQCKQCWKETRRRQYLTYKA